MIVSVMTPTRERPEMLLEMLESAADERVEHLVGVDSDDPRLMEYAQIESPNGMMYVRRRMMPVPWWNWLAERATGDFLAMGNDDIRFQGPEWLERLETLDPAEPAVIGFKAGTHGPEHFELPIISRGLYEVMGFYTCPNLLGIYSDTFLYAVGKAAGILKYFGDVEVVHLHWADPRPERKRPRDDTDKNNSHDTVRAARLYDECLGGEFERIVETLR